MKKFLRVAGTIIFGLLIIFGGVGYYLLHNFDLNKYKPLASEMVEKELGRKLVINGDASIGISLVPTIVIEDVELANASWAKNPQMVKVKRLEVKFALLPLLKKQIVIDKIVVMGPEVYLEMAKDGKASWDFAGKVNEEKTAAKADAVQEATKKSMSADELKEKPELALLAGFAAKSVEIENGIFEYNDQKSGSQINLVINDFTFSAPSVDDPVTASFDLVYNQQKIKGNLDAGSINQLLKSAKEAYPVDLTAKAYGIDIAANGSVIDVMDNLQFAFLTNIYNPAGNMNAPETTLKAKIDGNLKNIAADIELLNIVTNVVTGNVKVNLEGKLPFITANLNSAKINLQTFSQNSNFAMAVPALINEAQALAMVPADPIPYSALKSVNAQANVTIKELVVSPALKFNNVLLKANLQNGLLNVNPLQLMMGKGEIDISAVVNAATQALQLKAVSKNMDLQSLHKEFLVEGDKDFGVLSGGKFDLDVNLSGSGSTYRQLAESLKGQAIAIVNESVIQTGGLNFMTGNFLTQLLNTLNIDTKKSTKLDLACAVIRADLGGGKASFPKGIAVQSKQLSLVSDGNINLVNDKLDFSLRPFSGKVVDTNVAQAISSMIKIKGTLESPKVALDDKEALKTIVGVAATGGTAYLGSKLLLDVDSSPCYTALQGTPYASRFPKPTGVQAAGQDIYNDTSAVVNGQIKAIEGVAKDVLSIFKKPKGTK